MEGETSRARTDYIFIARASATFVTRKRQS
jgi:hypothetical protein